MALEVLQRSSANLRGFVTEDKGNTVIYGEKKGIAGKIGKFVNNPGPEANKLYRYTLATQIDLKYGQAAAKHVEKLINPDSTKPLSLRDCNRIGAELGRHLLDHAIADAKSGAGLEKLDNALEFLGPDPQRKKDALAQLQSKLIPELHGASDNELANIAKSFRDKAKGLKAHDPSGSAFARIADAADGHIKARALTDGADRLVALITPPLGSPAKSTFHALSDYGNHIKDRTESEKQINKPDPKSLFKPAEIRKMKDTGESISKNFSNKIEELKSNIESLGEKISGSRASLSSHPFVPLELVEAARFSASSQNELDSVRSNKVAQKAFYEELVKVYPEAAKFQENNNKYFSDINILDRLDYDKDALVGSLVFTEQGFLPKVIQIVDALPKQIDKWKNTTDKVKRDEIEKQIGGMLGELGKYMKDGSEKYKAYGSVLQSRAFLDSVPAENHHTLQELGRHYSDVADKLGKGDWQDMIELTSKAAVDPDHRAKLVSKLANTYPISYVKPADD